MELLNEGGLLVFVTLRGIADTPGNKFVREYLVSHADIISALMLHDTLFMQSNSIEVRSDLLIFQKHTHKASLSLREKPFLQTVREKADTQGAKTEYANRLFSFPKTALATDSGIVTTQYGKKVRRYRWSGDENSVFRYFSALLQYDFGQYFRKNLFNRQDEEPVQMSLFGGAATVASNKGRRTFAGEMPGWMKEDAMVMYEGQVGTLQFRRSSHYEETAVDFVPLDEGKAVSGHRICKQQLPCLSGGHAIKTPKQASGTGMYGQ